jgi:hypothetical protein
MSKTLINLGVAGAVVPAQTFHAAHAAAWAAALKRVAAATDASVDWGHTAST